MPETVRLTGNLCAVIGAQVTWRKSSGLWPGVWDGISAQNVNVNWSFIPGYYLGVPLNHHRDSTHYWARMCEDLQSAVKNGSSDLFIFARARVCNILLVAILFHVMQFMCSAHGSNHKLHCVLARLVWRSGSEPMRRDNLFRSVISGGLGLTHLF